jgi:hypothetical protein
MCRVSFRDSEGVEHAVEVEAWTLYEAVGLAIDRFRRLRRPGGSPADVSRKNRLKELLGDAA